MGKTFVCSLCRNGIIGGGFLDFFAIFVDVLLNFM